jgi:hypothetical protein
LTKRLLGRTSSIPFTVPWWHWPRE